MSESKKKRYTIAIMLGYTQSDYSESLLRGFYTCAKEENVNILFLMGPQMPQYCMDILFCNIEGNYAYQFDAIYEYTHFAKPDALIVTYGSLSNFHSFQNTQSFLNQFSDIPYLLLEETSPIPDIPYFLADNYNGMRACIEHLVCDHHYRKVAFLSGPKNNNDSKERLQAYYDVMRENHLTVTDTMIAYGDYSEVVYDQIEFLLDSNPGLEAIACANDTMAKACYRVCAMRNILVGKNLAITGFDDVESARTMAPPLTSVAHSSFQFSYTALKSAIALCEGKKPYSHRMPVSFRKRCSCGCDSAPILPSTYVPQEKLKEFLQKAVDNISKELLSNIPYRKHRNRFKQLILDYFTYIYRHAIIEQAPDFHMDYLFDIMKQFSDYQHISISLLQERFVALLQLLLANAWTAASQNMLSSIINATQQNLHSTDILKLEQELTDSNKKAWFVPSFTRDLTQAHSVHDLHNTMQQVVERLKLMDVRSGYFYLFREPLTYEPDKPISFPPEIYLHTYFTPEVTVCHEIGHCPKVTCQEGLTAYINQKHPACFTAFILFSGAKQYGVMLCESKQEDIAFLQICSMQLGSLFHFIELNILEHESQIEIENSFKIIQEQNRVLSFVSEYDELSQLLNRRGFMERALQLCENNIGKKAHLIFGDLDHLKEINDCFGHAAGDFAISCGSNRLRDVLPDDAITARIGGDEFISLILSEDDDFQQHILAKLTSAGDAFNRSSDKPYYVDFSFGIYDFVCDPAFDLNQIIQQSDKLLYEAKALRRKSIRKDAQ